MNKSSSKRRKVLKPSTAVAGVKKDKGLALRKCIREVQLPMSSFSVAICGFHVSMSC